LQFTFEFIRRLIIRECAFLGDEVENHLVVTVVTYITSNQSSIPYHAPDIWLALKKKIPLVPYPVHFFLLKLTQSQVGQGYC